MSEVGSGFRASLVVCGMDIGVGVAGCVCVCV